MLISREKRRSNIVEYLLYMYQIEDIIRSFQFDITQIDANVVQRFDQPAAIKLEIKLWYADLIDKIATTATSTFRAFERAEKI